MEIDDLLHRIRSHQKWIETDSDESTLRWSDENVNFLRENWSGSNLSCALLFDSNFDGCNLSEVDFFQADLQGSTFVNAMLSDVILSKVNIDGCVFNGARLDGAKLRRIKSIDVDFIDAQLANADLGISTFTRGNFNKADLSRADLSHVVLDNCSFCESKLTGVKGLEYVRIESFLTVGPLKSPKKLTGQAAVEWLLEQTV